MGRVIADDTAVRGGAPAAGVRATVCACRTLAPATARPGVGFPSMPRGSMRPVPMAVSGASSGSLASARFVTPAGGAFGAGGVLDASGAMAPLVVIEPQGATAPAGETGGREAPGGTGEPAGGAGPATGQPGAGPATDPALKPASTTPRITTTTKATVTKATASKPSKAKAASAAATLPKTTDVNWIAVSLALFLLGAALLGSTRRSTCAYTLPG